MHAIERAAVDDPRPHAPVEGTARITLATLIARAEARLDRDAATAEQRAA